MQRETLRRVKSTGRENGRREEQHRWLLKVTDNAVLNCARRDARYGVVLTKLEMSKIYGVIDARASPVVLAERVKPSCSTLSQILSVGDLNKHGAYSSSAAAKLFTFRKPPPRSAAVICLTPSVYPHGRRIIISSGKVPTFPAISRSLPKSPPGVCARVICGVLIEIDRIPRVHHICIKFVLLRQYLCTVSCALTRRF